MGTLWCLERNVQSGPFWQFFFAGSSSTHWKPDLPLLAVLARDSWRATCSQWFRSLLKQTHIHNYTYIYNNCMRSMQYIHSNNTSFRPRHFQHIVNYGSFWHSWGSWGSRPVRHRTCHPESYYHTKAIKHSNRKPYTRNSKNIKEGMGNKRNTLKRKTPKP